MDNINFIQFFFSFQVKPSDVPLVIEESVKATDNDRTLTPEWNTKIPLDALENHPPVRNKIKAVVAIVSETVSSSELPDPTNLGQHLKVSSETSQKRNRKMSATNNYETCPTCNTVRND